MFDFFLDTSETIPEGVGFQQFGTLHLLWLTAFIILFIVMIIFFRKMKPSEQRKCLVSIAILLVASEIVKFVILLIGNRFEWDYLPLHLCSMNIFIILSHALKPTKFKAEFLYALCLPGATAALLFPGWPSLPFLNFIHIHSFVFHALLLIYPILLIVAGFKPDYKQLSKCLLFLLVVSPILYGLNKILDTNFMFLNNPGTGNPLALFEKWLGNPGYIAGFFVLLAIVWSVLYVPIIIKEKLFD